MGLAAIESLAGVVRLLSKACAISCIPTGTAHAQDPCGSLMVDWFSHADHAWSSDHITLPALTEEPSQSTLLRLFQRWLGKCSNKCEVNLCADLLF